MRVRFCCAVDCTPCFGPTSLTGCTSWENCPAICNPKASLSKGLCNDCKAYQPVRKSKKERRREKVAERKAMRYS